DNRIQVIHQQNQGVSAARNAGLDRAGGEWVCFVDGDDYVDTNYLSTFAEQGCLQQDCFNIQGWHSFSDVDNSIVFTMNYPDLFVGFKDMARVLETCNYFSNSRVMEKLFNKNVLDDNRIRFRNDLTVREDALFVFTYRTKMKSMRLLPVSAYYYRQAFKRSSLSSKNHPYNVHQTLKKELLPMIRQVFELWGILDVPRAAEILSRNKNMTCLSIIKSLYAHNVPRRERLEAWHDIFDDNDFFHDPYFRVRPLLNVFRIGCRYFSIPFTDALCYFPFRIYYKFIK
ncbi:MAG: glycosyltransferase, partial [Odoribacter sp.]|nr:glycosyltransferase [Odoribacter sp.]